MEKHQQLCQHLLNKRGGEKKLEVWVGSGNNGKTTLFSRLVSGMSPVLDTPEVSFPCQFFQSNDMVVVGVPENYNFDDTLTLVNTCFDFFNQKPVRVIAITNHLPNEPLSDLLDVYQFNHKF